MLPASGASEYALNRAATSPSLRRNISNLPEVNMLLHRLLGIVVVGLLLVPFPGPGWLVVFLGLGVWASEFEWAQHLLHRVKRVLGTWSARVRRQPWWVKGLVLLATGAAVAAIFWLMFVTSGVPGFFPDPVEVWLKTLPGVD